MSSSHDNAIRRALRAHPKSRVLWGVLAVFLILPLVIIGIVWLDRPSGNAAAIRGIVTHVVYATGARYQPRQVTVTAKLEDGTSVTCASFRDVRVGDNLTATRDTSRLLRRSIYAVTC
jgi:hypothetical protein